jgi:hypothetical protein
MGNITLPKMSPLIYVLLGAGAFLLYKEMRHGTG